MKKSNSNHPVLILLLLVSLMTSAQSLQDAIDNLKSELKTNPDAKRTAVIYSDLTWYFSNISIDSALVYGEKAIKESYKVNDSVLIAQVYSDVGAVYFRKGDYEESKSNYLKSFSIRKNLKDSLGLAKLNINLGNLFMKNYEYENALNNFLGAIDYFESKGNYSISNATKSNVGLLFFELKNYKKSIQYLNEAIEYQEENKQEDNLTNSYLSLGNCFLQLNDTVSALKFFNKTIRLAKKNDNKIALASAYNNVSVIKTSQNKHQQAASLLNQSKILKEVYNADIEKAVVKLNSVEELLRQKKFKDAKATLLELKKEFEKNASLENLVIVYNNLITIHGYLKNVDSTVFYFNRYKQVKSQLLEKQVLEQTNELETKYQTEKKEKDLLLANNKLIQNEVALQKEKLAVQNKNNTILMISIGSGFLLILGFGFYRRKQLEQKAILAAEQTKQRELLTRAVLEAEETERKRIASDLHDGVGQLFSAVKMNLGGLFNRIKIEKDEDKFLAEKTLALVDESCKEVRVISHKMMPNFLLKSGIASDIKSFVEKIDENTLKISFESKGFKDQLEFNEEIILYRVIQELINNVIKHAKANELKIVLEKNKSEIVVRIIDNGVGFNYEKAIEKGGLGLKNILVRIEYLKGTIQFLPNEPSGTEVLILVPLE